MLPVLPTVEVLTQQNLPLKNTAQSYTLQSVPSNHGTVYLKLMKIILSVKCNWKNKFKKGTTKTAKELHCQSNHTSLG